MGGADIRRGEGRWFTPVLGQLRTIDGKEADCPANDLFLDTGKERPRFPSAAWGIRVFLYVFSRTSGAVEGALPIELPTGNPSNGTRTHNHPVQSG